MPFSSPNFVKSCLPLQNSDEKSKSCLLVYLVYLGYLKLHVSLVSRYYLGCPVYGRAAFGAPTIFVTSIPVVFTSRNQPNLALYLFSLYVKSSRKRDDENKLDDLDLPLSLILRILIG